MAWISDRRLGLSIEAFELSKRTITALSRDSNIYTLGDLLDTPMSELFLMPGIGKVAFDEILCLLIDLRAKV